MPAFGRCANVSLTRSILFGATTTWFSRAVAIVLGLVLLPVLFRTLPKEELGLWLLLAQSWGAIAILDMGFGVTITRRIAFAKGRSGSDPDVVLTDATRKEIADLVATSLRIYRALAVFTFAVSFGLGFVYLRSLELDSVPLSVVWMAWGVLCLSQALAMWAAPWTCLLQGVGQVGWDAILASFVNCLTLIGQIFVALLGGGLISLAVVAALGVLLQRTVILNFARRKRPDLFELRGKWSGGVVRDMLPLAGRAWLTALGSALLLYSDQFVIASLEGAKELPAYRAAWVMVHNFTVLAVTLGAASGVFVSHLWQQGNLPQVHRIVERNVRFGWFTMLAAAGLLLFAGETLVTLWLGPGNFVGYAILAAFLLTATLDVQSHSIVCAARATGDEVFAWSYLLAGGLKLGLSLFLAQHYGPFGVALGTVIALLLTNHWYVPWRGLQSVSYSRRHLLTRTVLPAGLWFGTLAAALWVTRDVLVGMPTWLQLAAAVAIVALLYLIALAAFVLEPPQRKRLWALVWNRY